MSSFVSRGVPRVVPWLILTSVACDVGTFTLGSGPEHEGSLVTGGASGSATGGSASTTGGAGGSESGAGGTDGGASGAGAGGGGTSGMGGTAGTTGVLIRVSGPDLDTPGNLESRSASITGDGRFIVYESDATNIAPDDTNQASDIFLFDSFTGKTGRISTTADGTEANGASLDPAISADGTRIAFSTFAENLYPVTFSFGLVMTDLGIDLTAFPHELTPIVYPDALSSAVSSVLTGDGWSVVFVSADQYIVPGDMNRRTDYFVYDTGTGETTRVWMLGDDATLILDVWRPDISQNGVWLGFSGTYGTARRNVYRVEISTGNSELVGVTPERVASSGTCYDPSFSENGHFVAFVCDGNDIVENDTNGVADVFFRDLSAGVTQRVSVATDGSQANGPSSSPALSGDGRYVVFQTNASNLGSGPELTTEYGALVVYDRMTAETRRITNLTDSGADGPFEDLSFSLDGKSLVFESRATRLIEGTIADVKHVYLYEFP